MSHSRQAEKEGYTTKLLKTFPSERFMLISSDCIMCLTGTIVLQVWINQGDIILIGLRDYQDTKVAQASYNYSVFSLHIFCFFTRHPNRLQLI